MIVLVTLDGRLLGQSVIIDPRVVAAHADWLHRAWDAATPRADYVAEDPTREWPGPGASTTGVAGRTARSAATPTAGASASGKRLRRLRQDADLSGKQLAEQLGWPASKVSRLEHGRQTAALADIEAWSRATAAPEAVRDEPTADMRSLRVEDATWRRQLRNGFAPRQRVNRIIDDETTRLRELVTAVVPGLLQTADYARALYQPQSELHGQRDVESAVHERLRRQEVLYRTDRRFDVVITENGLRSRFGNAAVHRAQLDRLLVLAGLDTIDLRVLPWSAEGVPAVVAGFVIYDDRLAVVGTFNAELAIREPEDVALYARIVDMYAEAALQGEAATRLITRIALEL